MKFLSIFFIVALNVSAQEGVWYKSMSEALKNPSEVYLLKLKRKGLTRFPKELSRFPNLLELDLSKNNIKGFPSSLSHLSQLKRLDLSRNSIDRIPRHITQLKSLEWLDLWDNYIDELPKCITELSRLMYFDVRGVAMKNDRFIKYSSWMEGVEFYISEPCDCQE